MRRALFPVILGLAATLAASSFADDKPAAPPPPAAPEPKLQSLPPEKVQASVVRVQAFYDKTGSFASEFTQEFWVKAYNQKKVSKGKVTISKPGKMHWHYDEPRDNRVVSDGATVKVYEHANKQMYEQAVDKSQYPAALSFLTGTGKLSETFNFELFPGEKMAFPGGEVLVGTPKVATPAYSKVLFYVDSQTAQIRRVLIIDAQGNRNRFDFVNPQVNQPVAAEFFRFTPPPGTQIVRP
ncbi:MAG: outer membrane lipoprotein carrier protein LolA [Myxococcales bacterium]|jgi:outer membrane lipoprotein carrier protein|nr:outer membrane lipoprotein carrier protein LolA [Myxococcales bacterium]